MHMPEAITSRDNAKIKYACAVRDSEKRRREDGVFFAEGARLCLALAEVCPVRALYAAQDAFARLPELESLGAVPVSAPVADKLADTKSTQGVFGLFAIPHPDAQALCAARRVLALENVQDPGNVGTLLRSAAAFGFDAVLLGGACASPFAPKTLRAGMGATVRLPIFSVPDLPAALQKLRARGIPCLAAALYESQPLDMVACRRENGVCVVIGNEGGGLTPQTVAACDFAVRIPMTDRVESLNAAVAGSVLLWHFREVP